MSEIHPSLVDLGAQKLGNRYELVSLLGRGGMGSVYLARDLELDELVALKTLSRDIVDLAGMMERFRREVKLARKVTHKNVARTFDIGEHEGLRFLTMEYIEGESLGQLIDKGGALAIEHAITITKAIAEGLAAAHEAGVVHRDLKPDNIILGKDGRVVITDFGIAASYTQAQGNLTQGRPLGTPAYMAPEQVEGKAADHRADIYAVSEILYEMLTGTCPFRGDTVFALASARLLGPPPNPCAVRVSIPQALGAVVQKAMARDPNDRPQDIRAFIDALGAISLPNISLAQTAAHPPGLDSTMPMSTPFSFVPMPTPSSSTLDGKKSLVVIPFRNAGTKEDDYLSTALSEGIVDSLSMSEDLRVFSLAAARASFNEGDDPRLAGQRMGAEVVVAGTVIRSGERLRVTARLISTEDGFQIWAKRLEGSVADVFTLSDEAADAIVKGLSIEKNSIERALPKDPVVLDLYLRALHEVRLPGKTKAIELLTQALSITPDDPSVLALYARAQLGPFAFDDDPAVADEAGRLAREAAMRAISLAPNAALPHFALAELARAHGNYQEAIREYSTALRTDDRLAEAHLQLGFLRARAGDPTPGLRLMKRALTLEPTYRVAISEQLFVRELIGEPEAADELFAEPPPADLNKRWSYWYRWAQIAVWRKDFDLVERAFQATEHPLNGPGLIMMSVVRGRQVSAAALKDLERRARVGGTSIARTCFFSKIAADIWSMLDQPERAMTALRDADTAGLYDVLWLTRCPVLAQLRAHPDFPGIEARARTRANMILDAFKRDV